MIVAVSIAARAAEETSLLGAHAVTLTPATNTAIVLFRI
jgi:hypothetical protein